MNSYRFASVRLRTCLAALALLVTAGAASASLRDVAQAWAAAHASRAISGGCMAGYDMAAYVPGAPVCLQLAGWVGDLGQVGNLRSTPRTQRTPAAQHDPQLAMQSRDIPEPAPLACFGLLLALTAGAGTLLEQRRRAHHA